MSKKDSDEDKAAAFGLAIDEANRRLTDPKKSSRMERIDHGADAIMRAIPEGSVQAGRVVELRGSEPIDDTTATPFFAHLIGLRKGRHPGNPGDGYLMLVMDDGECRIYRVMKYREPEEPSEKNPDGIKGNDYVLIDRWEPTGLV